MNAISIFLFVLGIILIFLETFLPGGIAGALGVVSIVSSFFMSLKLMQVSIVIVLIEFVLIILLIYFFIKYLKKKQLLSKIILFDKLSSKKEISNLNNLIGREGITKTTLRPSGTVDFNGILLEVVSEDGYINNNVKVRGSRILENKLYVKLINHN